MASEYDRSFEHAVSPRSLTGVCSNATDDPLRAFSIPALMDLWIANDAAGQIS